MTDPQTIIERFRTIAEKALIREPNLGFLTWETERQTSFLQDLLWLIAKHRPPKTTLALVNMLLDLLKLRRRRGKNALRMRVTLIGQVIKRGLTVEAIRMLPRANTEIQKNA